MKRALDFIGSNLFYQFCRVLGWFGLGTMIVGIVLIVFRQPWSLADPIFFTGLAVAAVSFLLTFVYIFIKFPSRKK
ncbi:hypothetical protein HY502_00830 [Candidatus Woesebacteria bacterium]|nr:hypothetical protein [Candidatus Woesebacteria bacterium]